MKTNSFSIHFTILLANDSGIASRKKTKNSQEIVIAILLESETDTALEGSIILRSARERRGGRR